MSINGQVQQIELRASETCQTSSPEPSNVGFARDEAIDFTKGMLVLFMVLYHWLNYFVGTQGRYYDYLRFLTPSFIFISGFMISSVHLNRYEKSGSKLFIRLSVRGFKLLGLVFFLNALISLLSAGFQVREAVVTTFLRNIGWALIVANPTASQGQKGVAFSMLVPISYLLIASAILIRLGNRKSKTFQYALLVLTVVVAVSYACGVVSSYLDLLMTGVLGVVIGFAKKTQMAIVLGHPYLLIALYCSYLAVITVWGISLPLQVASVLLTSALLYLIGKKTTSERVSASAVLLGKYSLLGYIAQIAILQALRRIPWFSQQATGVLIVSLLLGTLLTLIVVYASDFARRKSAIADSVYRFVFA